MTKENKEIFKNRAIKIGLIIALAVLGVLTVLSLIGLILSLCGVVDLLAVSVTVLAAALSSIITIVALVLTLKSDNETLKLKRAEQKSNINKVRNSLSLEKVEIHKELVHTPATHINANAEEREDNFHMTLVFSADNIHEISGAALNNIELWFLCASPNNEPLVLRIENKQIKFLPIISESKDIFKYEVITNVTDYVHEKLCNWLGKVENQKLEVVMSLTVQSNSGENGLWNEKNCRYTLLELSKTIEKKQIYIFNKCH